MKSKTRYFLLCIGAISISIVVGISFLPLRWSYIFYGVLAFVVGSVVQTEEWKTGKRVRAAIFIIAIAVGGLLTTKGWNELGRYSQKKALIVALAREWLLNELPTLVAPMTFDANDPNLGEKHFLYPQFRTSAQDHILTSSLFDLSNRKDKELLLAIVNYDRVTEAFNTLLARMNDACTKFPEDVGQQKRKKVYLAIRDNTRLHIDFKKSHKGLLKLLEKEYSWALDEAKQMIDPNLLLSKIKE